MRNIYTICKRDLLRYFTSPIGYIFIIVFNFVTVGLLFMLSFFQYPMADMRPYFGNLPLVLAVFIPAVTMRLWAEERKENIWEMLLTFPMRPVELVLGKFVAAVIFYAITLAATVTLPLTLAWLGNPDNGAVVGGYIGAFLLGTLFLSLGIFFSGFCRDQIVAFVVTLMVCVIVFMLGLSFVASYIDNKLPGDLGTLLREIAGVMQHYDPFTRGVIELNDVLYFVIWTAIFLTLNVIYIDGRQRPHARSIFGGAVALSLAIGLAFNWLIVDTSLARADLTENNIYTVADATKEVLADVEAPVQVKVYITPEEDMPTSLKNLEQDITDKLAELRIAAGGNLEYQVIYLNAAEAVAAADDMFGAQEDEEEEQDETEALEARMRRKGVQPFVWQAGGVDEVTQKLIYSSVGVAYLDREEEIIPRVDTNNLDELEYQIVNKVYKLKRETKPVVALYAPKQQLNIPPQQRQMYQQLGMPIPEEEDPYESLQALLEYEDYAVERVALTAESPMPEEYDALVVVNPEDFNERQLWELNRALVEGKPVFLAVQQYLWQYIPTRDSIRLQKQPLNPGVNEVLEASGLGVDKDVLLDVNHLPLTVSSGGLSDLFGGGTTVNLPLQITVKGSGMDEDSAIVNRLSEVIYFWGTALEIDPDKLSANNLEADVLMETSKRAWKLMPEAPLTTEALEPPEEADKAYPLMAAISGQFADAYKDEERPAWPPPQQQRPGMPAPPPPEEGPAPEITPAEGELILVGNAEMFRRDFLGGDSLNLFLNSVDTLTMGPELVQVRGKRLTNRAIETPSEGVQTFWMIVNFAAVPAVAIAIGVAVAAVRRARRTVYGQSHAA